MQKYKLKSWLGETIPLQVEWDTDIVANATLIVYGATSVVFEKTAPFVENIATLDVTPTENTGIGAGVYKYLVKIEYPGGEVDILPDGADIAGCENGMCIAPDFEICEVPA